MHRVGRPLAILSLAALAIFAVGCGVEAGDQAASDAVDSASPGAGTEPGANEPDPTVPRDLSDDEQDAVDAMTDTYVELGFSEEEASCLANGMIDAFGGTVDPTTGAMDVMNECDIPTSRLMDIMGGGSMEDTMRKSLAAGFRQSGMTDEQADCVADAYVEEFGTDATASQDIGKMNSLFEGCGIDPADLDLGD